MPTSRLSGFYRLSVGDRQQAISSAADLGTDEICALHPDTLTMERADQMIENVVGVFSLPLGVGLNFLINRREVLVPMAVEEPSVVAAVSNVARLVRRVGGFVAEADPSVMIGQVQLVNVSDPVETSRRIERSIDELMSCVNGVHPLVESLGMGVLGMEVRTLRYDEPGQQAEDMVVLHFFLDVVDAMGANLVNTLAERLAPILSRITGEKVGLRIVSNFASRRLARASCSIPFDVFDRFGNDGAAVARGIAQAYRFAWADPFRATTHNKGVMNGVDAVSIATGNDWRAIEAGAHAWAARDGHYRPLTRWTVDTQMLHGHIELPMQVGTVGGTLRNHPTVAANLKILGNPRARELAMVVATVGLAQNLAALLALSTEGIQRGHMRLHARALAGQVGANREETQLVATRLCARGEFTPECAREILADVRHHDGMRANSYGAGTQEWSDLWFDASASG
jgi:hydroxymethylglutaryl-CoA reductase